MLLVSENETFEVPVMFTENNGALTFYEPDQAPEGAKKETFLFRRPNWADMKAINSGAMTVDATGKPNLDIYRFMDMKIRTLLKDWSLMANPENKLQITQANINKLHPDLLPYLFSKMEERLTAK